VLNLLTRRGVSGCPFAPPSGLGLGSAPLRVGGERRHPGDGYDDTRARATRDAPSSARFGQIQFVRLLKI